MKKFEVENHEASFLPDGEWKLVWSDEFDGTQLDKSKWDYRLAMMGQRWISWTDNAVELDGNSNAVFKVIEEDGRPACSQLQTGYNYLDEPAEKTTFEGDLRHWPVGRLKENLFTKKYGYFECRCRLQQMPGWWSAFWIQSPVIGSSLDCGESGAEIDVMESFSPGEIDCHNIFTCGYGKDLKRLTVGGNVKLDVKEFHRFGVLWDENGYTFYIDGKEDGHISENISHRPEFILISTEVFGYRTKNRIPSPAVYEAIKANDTFLVDYVRVFDKI